MSDKEEPTVTATPNEQPDQSTEEGGANGSESVGRQHTSDSWVLVDDPNKEETKTDDNTVDSTPQQEAETEPQETTTAAAPPAESAAPADQDSKIEQPAEPKPDEEKPTGEEEHPEAKETKETQQPESEENIEKEKELVEPTPTPADDDNKKEVQQGDDQKAVEATESQEKVEEGGVTDTAAAAKSEEPKKEEKKVGGDEPGASKSEGEGESEAKKKDGDKEVQLSESTTVEVEVEVGGAQPQQEVEEKEELPEPGAEIKYGKYLRQLKSGSDLVKVKKNKTFPRVYRLEDDLQYIVWNSHNKKPIRAKISINSIKEVRKGRNTDSFKASTNASPAELCFSIIYISGTEQKVLDLVTVTEEERTAWIEGLKALMREEGGEFGDKVRDQWLKELFNETDKNGDGTLDMKEVMAMMKTLNVGTSKKILKEMFKEADSDGNYDGKLNFTEFCSLFKALAARPELRRLFYLYASKMEWLTVHDFQRFLQTEQGAINPSIEVCTQLIQKYESTDQGKEQIMLSLDGFTRFMCGPEGDIFNVDHTQVYQDMTQPLSAYYIASSHNTYLLEDQLKGPSSCEAYINALKRGCRCVELDCWDGPDNEPVIYHGYTLTSKILFKDVIEVIKEYAFKTSPYPVILSIENHCSIPQQHKMADYMETILGDLLFKEVRNEEKTTYLPSPEELKYKIFIKAKKLPKAVEEANDDEGEVSDEDEAAELDPQELAKVQPQPPKQEETAAASDGGGVKDTKDKQATVKDSSPKEGEDEGKKKEEEEDKTKQDGGGEVAGQGGDAEKPKENEQQKKVEEAPNDKGEEEKPKEKETAGGSGEGGETTKGEDEGKQKGQEKGEGTTSTAVAAAAANDSKVQVSPSKTQRARRVLSFRSRQKKTSSSTNGGQDSTARPAKKLKLSWKLSQLVNYVQSIHFKGFEELEEGKCFHMSSFAEAAASKLSATQASNCVQYNRRQLSRTYPAGCRVNSSNYDPVPMWNAGCQIVALNYQTEGRAMDFNDGKFRQNGGVGYILKPDFMREELARFDHNQKNAHVGGVTSKILSIKVISGQQLPKPGGSKKGEIIDPYVEIEIAGVGDDNQRCKTNAVKDNGFNPLWNEVFHFVVHCPELASVRFKVMDKDLNQDDFIGSFCLPFDSIVPGYRHIHLTYAGVRDQRIGNASLFVHIHIQDYVACKQKARTTIRVKKTRDYPEHMQVGHQAIDIHFRNIPAPLRRAVDLREDYQFSQLYFKELCGFGGHADIGECVELLAEKMAAAKLKLSLSFVAEKEKNGPAVYKAVAMAAEEGKSVNVSHTIQQTLEAFNRVNILIKEIQEHAEPIASELDNIYGEAKKQQDGLMAHLRETAAPPKRVDQVMDHYCRTMRTLSAESAQIRQLKVETEEEIKRMAAGAKSAGLEMKTEG